VRKICVVGVGYVGLVTGTCFADLGNQVICLDIATDRIEKLKRGEMPIYEPGLEELVARNVAAKRLGFTTSYSDAIQGADFIFIAVNTPPSSDGEADLQYVRAAAQSISQALTQYAILVNKSTVPVGTGDAVAEILESNGKKPGIDFDIVSNPEFLAEGTAVFDFSQPDRVVLGGTNPDAVNKVAQLYLPLRCAIMTTDLRTAEMIKYASNAFLATRISFINEIATICEKVGADVKEVAAGMGMDRRIGRAFLNAGLGYGGSCFPKDVKALTWMAEVNDCHPQLLRAVMEINRDMRRKAISKLRETLGTLRGKTIAIWGLAFKPNTDDVREAASLDIIHILQNEGAKVRAYDPVAIESARRISKEVAFCDDAYCAAENADALVLVTEWNEFKQVDMERVAQSMKQKILIDGRNIYDREKMQALGFQYRGLGRGN
jgi:UDPglucose 6-dehydrogenase